MILTRAPLRLPLGGGGTDIVSYASRFGGYVLSATIDKYVYISINSPRADDLIRLKYSRAETVTSVNQIENELIREAVKLAGIKNAVEITAMADVPDGSGLGSSGSFLVALLLALHTYRREPVSPKILAEEASAIEIDILGHPIGKHDQYMAAYGGVTLLKIDKNNEVIAAPAAISTDSIREMENNLILCYTGKLRRSTDVLSKQDESTKANDDTVIAGLHTIKQIGKNVVSALEQDKVELLGPLFDSHWQAKTSLSDGVSDAELSELYEYAKAHGADGGKLVGAGGGGFFAFCANGSKLKLRAALKKKGLREMPFRFDLEGAKVLVDF